ncbi:MAG: hypothetical protein MUO26_08225 [Methanotrichaceae archaeon]|nr:hypothetical protein [Methanotrichaceae archaeon]
MNQWLPDKNPEKLRRIIRTEGHEGNRGYWYWWDADEILAYGIKDVITIEDIVKDIGTFMVAGRSRSNIRLGKKIQRYNCIVWI